MTECFLIVKANKQKTAIPSETVTLMETETNLKGKAAPVHHTAQRNTKINQSE